jgi:hypothetical protein
MRFPACAVAFKDIHVDLGGLRNGFSFIQEN